MMKLTNILAMVFVLGLLVIGCGNNPSPTDNQISYSLDSFSADKIAIPDGATLESATLYIRVDHPSDAAVDIKRITSDWDEMTVTWANFGGAFDATVLASFVADGSDWRSADVTSLVNSWLDGTYDNFGMILVQPEVGSPYTTYFSREAGIVEPYLEICYNTGTEVICEMTLPLADTYIGEHIQTENNGGATALMTGYVTGLEKQTLVKFELETTEVELAEIGDLLWIDENKNGIQDNGEAGYPGATVELYSCLDELLTTTTTDANGFYIFTDLMPGDYYVKFIKPEGYEFTGQNIGSDDAIDSDVQATGIDDCTTLEAGESDMTHDAGIFLREMGGCTLTIGFWKNHAGFGPQDDVLSQFLPIWLGTDGGSKSLYVDNAAMAVDILKMKTYGKPSNGITKMYAQMLGAKLNMASGADYSAISTEIADADEFLADNDWTDWNKKMKFVINWMSTFDDYNNGDIGPGHCDEFGDDYDD